MEGDNNLIQATGPNIGANTPAPQSDGLVNVHVRDDAKPTRNRYRPTKHDSRSPGASGREATQHQTRYCLSLCRSTDGAPKPTNPRDTAQLLRVASNDLMAITKTYGSRVVDVQIRVTEIVVIISDSIDEALFPQPTTAQSLLLTNRQVQENAAAKNPKPSSAAVSHPELLPLLRALVNNRGAGDPPPTVEDASGAYPMVLPSRQDFVDAPKSEVTQQIGTYVIVGTLVTQDRKIQIILTKDQWVAEVDAKLLPAPLRQTIELLTAGLWAEGSFERIHTCTWKMKDGGKIVEGPDMYGQPESPNIHDNTE